MICELASVVFGAGVLTLGLGLFTYLRARDRMARADLRYEQARAKERRARELFNLTPYPYERTEEVTHHG